MQFLASPTPPPTPHALKWMVPNIPRKSRSIFGHRLAYIISVKVNDAVLYTYSEFVL